MNLFQTIWEVIRTERAPKWLAEPVRMIANRVAALTVVGTAGLIVLNSFTSFVPAQYHAQVSAVLAGLGVVLVAVAKVAGAIIRSKVFAPATVVAVQAGTIAPVVTTGGAITVVPVASPAASDIIHGGQGL